MTERLNEIERTYEEIGQKLCTPEVFSDPKKQKELLKKQKQLTPIVEQFRNWKRLTRLEQDALEACDDPELRELAREEYQQAKQSRIAAEDALRRALIPRDPDDDRSVILELRAGTGGEEAALFAGVLLRMYLMYADRHRFRAEIISRNETQLGGIKEAVLSIEGEGAYAKLKYESGVHRVQRVPETESQGRIQTSAATVAVLPEAEEIDLQIDPKDLLIETHRSGGAGGQHVNKTESAIRIVHLPSGIEVDCQDERSQYKNKDKAMKILRSRLLEKERAEQDAKIGAQRRSQVGSGDRSQRIRTYNFPQGRVTDHRIGLTLYRLPEILDGDLDELLDALSSEEETERLKAFSKEEKSSE